MSTLAAQVEVFRTSVISKQPELSPDQRRTLNALLQEIDAALANDQAVGFWNSAEQCQDWQVGITQGEIGASVNFWAVCEDWAYQVRQKLEAAQIYLASIGQPGLAEVAGSLAEQSATFVEQSDAVVPDDLSTWLDSTPAWLKYGAPALLVLLLLRGR